MDTTALEQVNLRALIPTNESGGSQASETIPTTLLESDLQH